MKQIKRIVALMLAMMMVMGMTVTAFATTEDNPYGTATITVSNLGTSNAQLSYLQIIKADPSKPTGWAFVDGVYAYYKTGFGVTSTNDEEESEISYPTEQEIIWKLIAYANQNEDGTVTVYVPTGTVAAEAGQISTALSAVAASGLTFTEVKKGVDNFEVNAPGVYAIKAVDTAEKPEYTYTNMAAYVSFKTYDTLPTQLVDKTIEAKRSDLKLTKSHAVKDDVVEVGKVVTYTIKTTVPYIADNASEVTFKVKDTISGATYVPVDSDSDNNRVALTVTVGDTPSDIASAEITTTKDGKQTFTVDLATIANNRKNAGQTLTIMYNATVTGTTVSNSAEPIYGTEDTSIPTVDTVYTGSLTITKYGDLKNETSDDDSNRQVLSGAKFEVYKVVKEEVKVEGSGDGTSSEQIQEKDVTYYAQINDNNEVTGWTKDEANAGSITTGEDGTATVKGLDNETTYKFKEIAAPAGYSLNENDATANWTITTEASDTKGSAKMIDTKLSALPDAGGIGTTIFTVAGILLMVAAAGIYFARRRRA
jgi:fimbrial isopeptide formation D2 family protein/LPXTG-motif cell wall-anchored protein